MEDCEELASKLVNKTYIRQGLQNLKSRRNDLKRLLEQRKIPENGWDDSAIESLIEQLSAMDSNNFSSNCGVGEREGRIYSALISRRHYDLAHGIG